MEKILERILDFTVGIKKIPAHTFIEGQHGVFMNNHFIYGVLADISINHGGDVYGWIPADGDAHQSSLMPRWTPFS
jgi:hypothetical protein